MAHHQFWRYTNISEHLYRLGVLQRNMFLFTSCFVERLVHELAKQSPLVIVRHDQQVVASRNKVVRDV